MKGVRRDASDEVAEIYAAACPRLIGYLTVLGGNRADAEEVAQEAFVRLLENWRKVRTYDDPQAWLRQVATRTGDPESDGPDRCDDLCPTGSDVRVE